MKLPRAAAALAVAAVLAVSVAAIARHYLHPAQLVDALARQLKQSTGRDLVIGGATGIKLFPRPAIVLEDVRFRNAAWGSQPWMATVDRAEAEMQWGPLLRGEISIARIQLAGAALLLETDAGGNGNWVMGSPDSGPADLSWLTGFQIDDLSLHPLKLGYRDGTTGDGGELLLHHLSLQAPAAPQPIHFHAQGTYSGNSFEAQGTVGALATLLAGHRPYPVAVSATLGGARIEINGDIAEPLEFTGLNLELRQQGAELGEIAALAGQSLPSLGAYRLSARISGSRDAPSLSAVDLAIGSPEGMEFRAQGGIELRRTQSQRLDVSAVDLDLHAQGRELREFLALAGKDIPPAGPYAMSARLSGTWDAPSLSGIEIDAGSPERVHLTARGRITKPKDLAGLDLEITAAARRHWRLGEETASTLLPPFRIRTRVRDRPAGYAFDDLDLEVAGSRVNATVVATRREQRLHVAARAASPLIDLARVLASADTRPASGGGSSRSGTSPGGPPVLLHLADVDLDLQIGKLVLRDGRALTGISGRVALTREKLAISSGRLTAGGAGVSVEGSVTDPGQGSGIDLALGIQGKELADLLNFWGTRI
ncbi:MAG TPA: AsmA family protein, partial [Burkholderiales bacterium]